MADFLAMGGYARWVWSAYGVAVVVLTGNVIAASWRYHHAIRRLRERSERITGSVTG